MNWDDLRFVLAIARERNLRQAAVNLGVAHTTVSRRLKTFEDELHVRLFDRTPDGFELTPAGRDLEAVAQRVERELLDAENRLLGRDAELRGRLRVSTLDFVFTTLSDHFTAFMDRYPGIDMTMVAANAKVSLNRREADVAMRLSNRPLESLVGRRVGHLAFAVYGARALVERVGEDAPLGQYPWLHWDERSKARWLDQWIDENAPGARIALRVSDSFMVASHYLRAGVGVLLWPCFLADQDPELVRLSEQQPQFNRDLWVLTLPELRGNSRIRAFMDHMEAALRPLGPALAGEPVDTGC